MLLLVSVIHVFLLLSSIPLYEYTKLFTCPSIGEYQGCFQFGGIMSKAAMNILIQVFLWTYVFISHG